MENPEIFAFMPFLCIGGVVLLMIVMIPLIIRRTRKKQKQSHAFFPELARKTGLTLNHDRLEGNYKGYQMSFRYKIDMNMMSAYKTVTTGNSNVWGKNAVYPKIHVEIMSPAPFPSIALFDPPNVLLNHHQWLQDVVEGRKPDYPKMEMDASGLQKGLNVYGTDTVAAQKLVGSMELKQLLSTWKYTDIRMEGNKLTLDLDNNNAPSTIGIKRMYTHAFAIQAMDIAIAAAKAVQN